MFERDVGGTRARGGGGGATTLVPSHAFPPANVHLRTSCVPL